MEIKKLIMVDANIAVLSIVDMIEIYDRSRC